MVQRVAQRELSRAHDERNHACRVHVHAGLLSVDSADRGQRNPSSR